MSSEQDEFEQVYSGQLQWYDPSEPLYISCCHCGLIHKVKFGIGHKQGKKTIWWKFWEKKSMTLARRKKLGVVVKTVKKKAKK